MSEHPREHDGDDDDDDDVCGEGRGEDAERTARNSWANRTIRLSLGGTISLEFIPMALDCSCTGVWNSYDALARARPCTIKGGIPASRYADDERDANPRDLSRGSLLLFPVRAL